MSELFVRGAVGLGGGSGFWQETDLLMTFCRFSYFFRENKTQRDRGNGTNR